MAIEAYPLTWPEGWPREARWSRKKSAFGDKSFALVRDELFRELKRYGAIDVILSTNIPLRKDGIPYSGYRQPDDVGVAVYFKLRVKGQVKPLVFACDKWTKIEDNIHAIYKTIDALRGIQRWGSSDLMERAFTGFTALPAPAQKRPWFVVLGLPELCSYEMAKQTRNALLLKFHPDKGGDANKAAEINEAFEEAKRARGWT